MDAYRVRPYTVDWESVCTDAYRVRSFPVGALHATPHREMGICVLYGLLSCASVPCWGVHAARRGQRGLLFFSLFSCQQREIG